MQDVSLTDRIDRPGCCVLCGQNMMTTKIIGSKEMVVLSPQYRLVNFVIDNGSLMAVCMCQRCQDATDLTDPDVQATIMSSVIKGWQLEVDNLVASDKHPDWDKAKADDYMNTFGKLSIAACTDTMDKNAIPSLQMKLFKAKG